jgi:hypothetical protein
MRRLGEIHDVMSLNLCHAMLLTVGDDNAFQGSHRKGIKSFNSNSAFTAPERPTAGAESSRRKFNVILLFLL